MNRLRIGVFLLFASCSLADAKRTEELTLLRWPDGAAMQNKDAKGVAHYPGWSLPALKYLYEERKITASGHETTDTDLGIATTKDDYSLETYILSHDHYQIELLTNLDQLPESGAIIIATFPKAKGGSGFPARVFAIAPN